jgi:hypothetical protein
MLPKPLHPEELRESKSDNHMLEINLGCKFFSDFIMISPLRIIVPLLVLGGWIYFRFFA